MRHTEKDLKESSKKTKQVDSGRILYGHCSPKIRYILPTSRSDILNLIVFL